MLFQWKVRRTLAFSIHELALIVGEDITGRDLLPVFDMFLNDLDEVRIGVLKHLADFIRVCSHPPPISSPFTFTEVSFLKVRWHFRRLFFCAIAAAVPPQPQDGTVSVIVLFAIVSSCVTDCNF